MDTITLNKILEENRDSIVAGGIVNRPNQGKKLF